VWTCLLDDSVFDFLGKIKELKWEVLENVHGPHILIWKLPTPRLAQDVTKRYLARVKPPEESPEEEVETGAASFLVSLVSSRFVSLASPWLLLLGKMGH
jgi:hypothetical protein